MCLTVLQAGSASAGKSVSGGETGACIFKKLSSFSNLQWPKQTSLHCNIDHE